MHGLWATYALDPVTLRGLLGGLEHTMQKGLISKHSNSVGLRHCIQQGKKTQNCSGLKGPGRETLTDTASIWDIWWAVSYVPSPELYCVQVTGPKAPWNQAVTTHEQEITRGTCRLSKDGSVGGSSLLPNNSPRCAANICAFRQQAEGS